MKTFDNSFEKRSLIANFAFFMIPFLGVESLRRVSRKIIRGKKTLVFIFFVSIITSSVAYSDWKNAGFSSGVECDEPVSQGGTFRDLSMNRCILDLELFSQIDGNPDVTFSNCRVFGSRTPEGEPFCQAQAWRDVKCPGTQIRGLDGNCADFRGVNEGGPQQCGIGDGFGKSDDGFMTNPINTLTGNKFQREVDYEGDGFFPLYFVRDYVSTKGGWLTIFSGVSFIPEEFFNEYPTGSGVPLIDVVLSQSVNSALGINSVMNFGLQRPNYFILRDPNAQVRLFVKESTNRYIDNQGSAYAKVIAASDGNFEGLEVFDSNNSILRYDEQGKLIQNRDLSSGISHDYSYQYNVEKTALISATIARNAGGVMTLNFNADGSLRDLLTPDQELIVYGYDGSERLNSIIYPGVPLPRLYHYEDSNFPNALTGITDENGVRFATWAYDAQGRAISSEHHNGSEKVVIDYTNIDDQVAPRVLIANELGKQTTYRTATFLGKKKIIQVEGHQSANCAAANKNYTYFPNGQVQTKTDWEGNTTSYEYNSRNLEISRTEAIGTPQGRTITTEWHPTFNLRTKITEPGRETVFAYDAEGRLTSQVTNNLPLN